MMMRLIPGTGIGAVAVMSTCLFVGARSSCGNSPNSAFAQAMADAAVARPTAKASNSSWTLADRLNLRDGHVQAVRVPDAQTLAGIKQRGESVRIECTIDGEPMTLVLEEHSLRAPGFKVIVQGVDGSRIVPPPPVTTYLGHVEGRAGSAVAASIHNGGVSAQIVADERVTWLQPLPDDLAGNRAGLHVTYRGENLIDRGWACGVDDQVHGHGAHPDDGGMAGEGGPNGCIQQAEIAFQADVEYFELNNSSVVDTVADIESVLLNVDFVYRRDVAITYSVTAMVIAEAEPDAYTSTDSGSLLGEFRSDWMANQTAIPRDIAHLMTGKEIEGAVIGVAWLPGVCDPDFPYGLSQSLFTTNMAQRLTLTAHELGHNWNAPHCNADPACSIMCSSVSGCNTGLNQFEPGTQSIIEAYRDGLNCLQTPSQITVASQRLLPNDRQTQADFGNAVAIDGDIALIGAFQDDSAGTDAGAVYAFRFDGTEWVQEDKIMADDAAAGDRFGVSVDVSGDLAIIGAYLDDDLGRNSGSAYIYQREAGGGGGGTWVFREKLLAGDGAGTDLFGISVGIAQGGGNSMAVVGAHLDDDGASASGSVYVFEQEPGGWEQVTKLIADEGAANDQFGWSVAIAAPQGKTPRIVVGAWLRDEGALNAGAVYFYRRTGGEWSFDTRIFPGKGSENSQLGSSVSIATDGPRAGDLAAAGAWTADGASPDSGRAMAFLIDGATWTLGYLPPSGATGDQFGYDVAVTSTEAGDFMVVGAPGVDSGLMLNVGAAYLYRFLGVNEWELVAALGGDAPFDQDQFGISVDIDGDVTLVGSWNEDSETLPDTGAAYAGVGLTLTDCNNNGVPDGCDIGVGTSTDLNANGIPDDCEAPICVADVAQPSDGVVGIADLLMIIGNWGPNTAGDIAPPGGDGVVGIADLLAVIGAWGPCP